MEKRARVYPRAPHFSPPQILLYSQQNCIDHLRMALFIILNIIVQCSNYNPPKGIAMWLEHYPNHMDKLTLMTWRKQNLEKP